MKYCFSAYFREGARSAPTVITYQETKMAKEKEKEMEKQEFRTVIAEEAIRGEYSNFVRIQHSGIDFRFDFAKVIPDESTVYVHTRMFISPIHAKMFLKALQDNVEKYESNFGKIELKMEKGIMVTGAASHEVH
jgi:hypothetical protein